MIASFALSNYGIGYVWIIRIYFIEAIIILFLGLLSKKTNDIAINIISIMIFIVYEIMCYMGLFDGKIIQYLFAYIPPCILLVRLAMYMFNNNKQNKIITTISFTIFIIICAMLYKITGKFVPTQNYKYPFRLYYLSYGIFVSGMLIMILKKQNITNAIYNKAILFISCNSLWIYLWHILVLYILKPFNITWYIKLIIVFYLSILIVFIQSKIVKKLENKIDKNILNIFRG